MHFRRKKNIELNLEDSLGAYLEEHDNVREVPLEHVSFYSVGLFCALLCMLFLGRLFYLNLWSGGFYDVLARGNVNQTKEEIAPRGIIYDRFGAVLADTTSTFQAIFDIGSFVKNDAQEDPTLLAIQNILGIAPDDIALMIQDYRDAPSTAPILLKDNLSHDEALALAGANLPAIIVGQGFSRQYRDPLVFAPIVGYTGLANTKDIARNSSLTYQDTVGKSGLELYYDQILRGTPGAIITQTDARGKVLSVYQKAAPAIGASLRLSIDADFQKYFYERLRAGLVSLGRDVGVGIAMNPETGEILSLVQIPSYNNAMFASPGHIAEKQAVLTSSLSPLFDRAIGGLYSPGSTIKPLVGVAALTEGIITPQKILFSPGYLDVPNPYDPTKPTRYLDWRYQGYINMASAIAQSSDVYFYAVGGGAFDVKGLGIERLRNWWQKFGLGTATGIDLPGEEKGFLPSPDWKEKTTGRPWLLGDTYNVSIGQGDLLLTPMQIINYISSIAANGKLYEPSLTLDTQHEKVLADLSSLLPEIKIVQQGMRETVTSPLGTAYTLNDLPFTVAAKTGSAQIQNNTQENAFFVGYAPTDHPQIAILVLIERSKEGSLNAVPIAKDVLNWYYQNRIANNGKR